MRSGKGLLRYTKLEERNIINLSSSQVQHILRLSEEERSH